MKKKKLKGKLKIQTKRNKEWGYILVERNVWFERRNSLLEKDHFWLNPGYDPHISIFTREEIQKIPKDFEFDIEEVDFCLTGQTKIVNPQTWKDVYSCIFEIVECPWAEKIRKDLGFTPLMRENHEFHVTLGIKTVPLK